jgi:hypothetical protein
VDLKIDKKSGNGVCDLCGCAFADYKKSHLQTHVQVALRRVEAAGWPREPPMPSLMDKVRKYKQPCIIAENQESSSVTSWARIVEEKAEALVTSGKVQAGVELVGAAACPANPGDLSMVGKVMEYGVGDDGARKKKLVGLKGRVVSVETHGVTLPVLLPQPRRKGNGKKKKAEPAQPQPQPCYASAWVRWFDEAVRVTEQETLCFLVKEKYNQVQVDGWRVYEDGEIEGAPSAGAHEESMCEKLDRQAFEAEMLCPKLEK